jgi:hypothetical protein
MKGNYPLAVGYNALIAIIRFVNADFGANLL